MKSKDEVMNDAMNDFDGQIPSVRLSMESRFNGVWENGYCHGFARGVKVGNADVQNKLDVIEEIKKGEYNRGLADGTALITDDTAIKALHRSGWLPEHDEEIFRQGRLTQEHEDIEKIKNMRANHRFELEAIKKREEAAYQKGYEAGMMMQHPDEKEAYDRGFEVGLSTAWDVARKLRHPSYSGVFQEERKEIFGYENADDVLTNLSAAEALLAVHEYGKRKAEKESGKPEKSDLKVGDCVLDGSGNFCTITQIGTHIHVMYPSGKTHKWSKDAKFVYVGRSFNTDLEAMKHKMEQAAP